MNTGNQNPQPSVRGEVNEFLVKACAAILGESHVLATDLTAYVTECTATGGGDGAVVARPQPDID